MNLQQMKHDLEQQLKLVEERISALDRMAQEAFRSLKERYDSDMNTMSELFLNLTLHEERERGTIHEKLGIEKKSGITAQEVLDPVEEQIFNIQEMTKVRRRAGMQSKIGV